MNIEDLANVTAYSEPVSECLEAFCKDCLIVLYRVPAGGMKFRTNRCDCSWRCCKTDQAGGGHHPNHIEYRPSTVIVTEFTRVKR